MIEPFSLYIVLLISIYLTMKRGKHVFLNLPLTGNKSSIVFFFSEKYIIFLAHLAYLNIFNIIVYQQTHSETFKANHGL